jgi:hypothetical protein
LAINSFASNKTCQTKVRIAIVDTGYTKPTGMDSANLCKTGHYDASTDSNTVGADENVRGIENHGTNIAHIIDDKLKYLGKNKYCLVIFKMYGGDKNPIDMSVKILEKIKYGNFSFVNYSTSGEGYDLREDRLIKKILDSGVIFAAAAGNKGVSLDKVKMYPAMYDPRILVVGNGFSAYNKAPTSNFGSAVKQWVSGENIYAGGFLKSGTSQSTAIFTARMAHDSIVYGCKRTN